MKKPLKYCVAVVVKNEQVPRQFLVVKRPQTDPDLGGEWGLPAVTLEPNELPEEGARRICREKLGCLGQAVRFLGVMFQERNSYDICLMDLEVQVVGAHDPDVTQATTAGTVYVGQKWTNNPSDLMPAARRGSCCASIYLEYCGLLQRDEWIASLEGSKAVA